MALLHYQNLDFSVHRPGVLMGRVVWGLKSFYGFLKRTKEYMESDDAVKRLAWLRGEPPAGDEDRQTTEGVWVQLTEPDDKPNEPETTFRDFLDENVREIYEWESPDGQQEAGQYPRTRIDFDLKHRIEVLDRDPETQQLLLERRPVENSQILLRPNTYVIKRQIDALQALQDSPLPAHLSLLRLFECLDHARWKFVSPECIEDWTMLSDVSRPGTDEQRRFVELALGTPDFAFLEGPPGSGKTTAICELILQLAKQGKRVLLCASTHVAVDNVLERLMDGSNPHRDLVIPVRIGDRRNVSQKARPYQIEEFVKTERKRLLRKLGRRNTLTSSQSALRDALRQGNTVIERMVLEAANLVCGTTIGILQHPDIRGRGNEHHRPAPDFDVLIVDEASKTPFQEFLVPALWVKRWIIVGDPKQLSPYVDDEAMAVNIEACLPEQEIRDACIDVFLATRRGNRQRVAAVAADSEETKRAYAAQCEAHNVDMADADRADSDATELSTASVVLGRQDSLRRRADELPLDVATVRCPDGELSLLRRRADAYLSLSGRSPEEQPEWASEVGWRLARWYEQRFAEEVSEPSNNHRIDTTAPESVPSGPKTTAQRLRDEVKDLLPAAKTSNRVWQDIDRVRRVALPSVLESLQHGFERNDHQRSGTALSDGLPPNVLEMRHVLLSTQHRMHPDIAAFSHTHIYGEKALQTPNYMSSERDWSYSRYAHRTAWIHVQGSFHNSRNEKEAHQITEELRHFDEWARNNPKNGEAPWEVAVLTFYRGQEREIRKHLRRWTKSHAMRHFRRRPHLVIELCTVDRFQGHEADFVLISFANQRSTSFLESPNRLNVALTRARYQRVIIGNRHAMRRRAKEGALRNLAKHEPWEQPMERTER